MADLSAIAALHGWPGAVDFDESPLGGIVARLSHASHSAIVALQGAQVLSWRHGPREMLWLSPVARIGTGKPVRGGIPVCWPWFGPHPSDTAKPAHGLVRTADWRVVATEAQADRSSLKLAFTAEPHAGGAWPHRAEVELQVTLGDGLSLELVTRNMDRAPIKLTEALHTYFRVRDIGSASIKGLAGLGFIDKLDGETIKSQVGDVTFDREVDRIYVGDCSAITLHDEGGHAIGIASSGSRSTVVWNPWRDKTARLGDLGSDSAYRRLVCIETANAGSDLVELAPGATHRLAVTYRLIGRAGGTDRTTAAG